MKSNLLSLLCVLMCSFPSIPKIQQSMSENGAIAKVNELPEVTAFIHKFGKQRPQLIVAKIPDKQFRYYWIKVGLGNMGTFPTTYNFYVDAKTNKVYYVDFMVDDNFGSAIISLQQWRVLRKDSAFQQMHYYKKGKLYLKKY